jgi:hypothetical protein
MTGLKGNFAEGYQEYKDNKQPSQTDFIHGFL